MVWILLDSFWLVGHLQFGVTRWLHCHSYQFSAAVISPVKCGTAAAVPLPFRPSIPALCGSCPLVTPYYCRLGDLLCFMYVYRYSCLLLSMHVCFVLFPLIDLSFVDYPSALWYCWLGLLTCKNRLPYNLYCVGGDVKHYTVQSNHLWNNSLCVIRLVFALCIIVRSHIIIRVASRNLLVDFI